MTMSRIFIKNYANLVGKNITNSGEGNKTYLVTLNN